jgi:4-carboxymuconolactone decarboxylase
VDSVFASIWTREGLERKQRSLVTIGILIALRQTVELKNHIEVGIRNGLSVQEIEEAILQAAAYAGFPAAWSAHQAAAEVLNQLGLIGSSKLPDD